MLASSPPHCVDFYRRARRNRPPRSLTMGGANNAYPLDALLAEQLTHTCQRLFACGRMASYGLAEQRPLLDACARLLGSAGLRASPTGDDAFLANGASECIDLVFHFLARQGMRVLLPLPAYFGYVHAAHIHGVPIAGYYRADGSLALDAAHESAGPIAIVVNTPNAIDGSHFDAGAFAALTDRLGTDVALVLLDVIYGLQDFDSPGRTWATVRAYEARLGLERLALLLTPSKDLGLPALRAGLCISQAHALVGHCRELIYARWFEVNPMAAALMLIYLHVLCASARAAGQPPNGQTNGQTNDQANGHPDDPIEQVHTHAHALLAERGLPHYQVPAQATRALLAAMPALGARIAGNLQLVRDRASDLLILDGHGAYAGYSRTAALRMPCPGPARVAELANRLLVEHGVAVYPMYTFGGEPHHWERLFPGQVLLRLNLSHTQDELDAQLALLRRGLHAVLPPATSHDPARMP